jgi:hypothetical protein
VRAEDRSTERGTVSWLVRRYVAGRTDITVKARQQYEWSIPHIENGREHELEALLIEANATTAELRREFVAAEHAVVELEQRVIELERDRTELMDQVVELRERVRQPTTMTPPRAVDRPGPPANRAARRRANRKRHT